ncbi:MAG: UDP-N-acetylmuramate:L-alanyl-gamma-D-glutamyl-meso-diaminopimelate ligase [Gammaproteobacteria bacterium]|nr:UDP-N-acetylmuramate:L-alanyl-gamma-D-glutamyl-meso-diaminopimelate ligase [Gammaproteobacteria bacterium]NIR82089.1 UDP-N-acetylmuramate:L-alanyl-gamma-D-glutamyl-meso-diaminopimelate ligase [Gammaproteobacteria bacterium]NIR89322.1 UDP-N-acetylmuramate:L-alanyl-gamma-D-glutamyl-meso-diaminopimelate ligase [Gammaproteobacteria bacterium]NIU03199.1 UDP-N-acetylmuramate:L-alanyl-gamma-D-glutamyl-meso-diaminopimelate ligase [Gammaproteobacteria bacterium]NIV50711.1 UDP-N-acetylmuramate:L-alany
MRIHILGICGTFMAGIASLARELGHRVTGSDTRAYPPMSDQLRAQGITVLEGYTPEHLQPAPDCVVVGNALTRGVPAIEYMLDRDLWYTSGPAWLAEHVLKGRGVIAVAGTHGKTTVTSMVAWVLEQAGLQPGFLVGGVPENLGVSARLGAGAPFVVEADEYDTAFFDKRSKFVHYRPRTLVLTNLEYDHADIFPDLAAIQRQFHHLVRIVPGTGRILCAAGDPALEEVLAMGCWTPVERFGRAKATTWRTAAEAADGSRFEVWHDERRAGLVQWELLGIHNMENALAAVAATAHAGVAPARACEALGAFRNVKRRLQKRASVHGVSVYDDFAHHPTAIAKTLQALRRHVGSERIIAVLEPRSNTMRLGVHKDTLGPALSEADAVWLHRPAELSWDPAPVVAALGGEGHLCNDVDAIVREVAAAVHPGDHVLIMSNGAFGGIQDKLIRALQNHEHV